MKKVLIIQRRMTEYRIPLFEKLRNKLETAGVKLNVIYGSANNEEVLKHDGAILPLAFKTPCYYFKIGKSRLVWQHIPISFIKSHDLIIITQENSLLFNYFLLIYRQLRNARVAFWGHGANFQITEPNTCRERFKSFTSRQVDWWFAYTSLSVKKIEKTGFDPEQITCLNNTVDTTELINWKKSITYKDHEKVRTHLGLCGKNVGIFIGSFYKDKRLDFLFEAADDLRCKIPDFELLLIGDGPLRNAVSSYADARTWVKWVGPRHGREKVVYATIGHVMLNPGLVGLGIIDSFALGIPMVTTMCEIHSPEIAYLNSGVNGIMVTDDKAAFVAEIEKLLINLPLLKKLRTACEQECLRYSLDNMVDNFSSGIHLALDKIRDRK